GHCVSSVHGPASISPPSAKQLGTPIWQPEHCSPSGHKTSEHQSPTWHCTSAVHALPLGLAPVLLLVPDEVAAPPVEPDVRPPSDAPPPAAQPPASRRAAATPANASREP